MTTPRQLLAQLERAERDATPPSPEARARLWSQVEAQTQAQADGGRPPLELDDAPLIRGSAQTLTALRVVGLLAIGGLAAGLGWAALDRDRRIPVEDQLLTSPPRPTADAPRAPSDESAASDSVHVHGGPVEAQPSAVAAPTVDDQAASETGSETEVLPPKGAATRARSPGAPKAKTLADELALMRALSTALKRGDSRTAQKLVTEHERDFSQGQFVEERMAAKARALCQAGRVGAGQRASERFTKRWPGSIHQAAVLADCPQEKN